MSNFRHGLHRSSTYKSWAGMKDRCRNSGKHNSHRYKDRGVTYCERWELFENFLADMGECPEGMTLDRYTDVGGNYEPKNCRWATPQEQARNRSNNRSLTLNGKTMLLCEWAEQTGLSHSLILYRLKAGWSVERALTTPPRPHQRRQPPS